MTQQEIDELYMRRCLRLASCGRRGAKPNPMVGAVIVARGRTIGEGYHIRAGGPHAEVNAFASVKPQDEPLIGEATVYVSLEPCAHWGKTPPCADLIVRKRPGRVVVGCQDPFAKVSGRGIERIRQAGIDVTVGCLEAECRWLNRRFITFHSLHRPYIILKWAQSANGFIDRDFRPTPISNRLTAMLSHKLRSEEDAILVGHTTWLRDCPQLNVRHWDGPAPRRVVLTAETTIADMLAGLYRDGVQSLIVEGGAQTHASFIAEGLYDELRIETAPITIARGTRAVQLPADVRLCRTGDYGGNRIEVYCKIKS